MASHPGYGAHTDPTFKSKPRKTGEVVRRVIVYLRPYKLLATSTVLFAILSLTAALSFPSLISVIVNEVITKNQRDILTPAAIGLFLAFFLREAFNSIRIRVNNRLEQNVIYDMRRQVYGKLQRLPIGWFDQRSSGDVMTRVIEDVNSVERLLIDGVEQGTVATLSILGALGFMFVYSPTLAAVALLPAPFLAMGAWWYTTTAHKRYRRQREAASAMNSLLMDNLQGIRQVKAFGRQDHEDARFEERADDLREGTLVVMRAWAWYGPAMQFVGTLGIGLVLWFGGAQVMAGKLDAGQLMAFILYAGLFFYEPITKLHGLNQMMQSARAAAARVFDILDAETERTDRVKQLKEPVSGEVKYDNVGFAYENDRSILKNVSLHAQAGEMIALVGPTGAGKSTLVSLLPALYEFTSGSITIDGQDVGEISLDSLRSHISVVSQEAFLFNGSIRENILYGKLDAGEPEMIAAAEAANCHGFISELPDGYDSHVGERGIKLSVGEKQRVSIARALLKDSPILILDEATASVDTATEKLIQEALDHLMKNRTSFVIAHRLSTIRKADQILVLRHGEIVECGNHEELLSSDGLYAKLARIQNTTFIEEGFEKLETTQPV